VYNFEYFLATVLESLVFKTPVIKKSHEMKNYAIIMPIENNGIKFNNKLSTLQRYDIAKNYGILNRAVQHLSLYHLTVSLHCHI
jgi:hypothetical protein